MFGIEYFTVRIRPVHKKAEGTEYGNQLYPLSFLYNYVQILTRTTSFDDISAIYHCHIHPQVKSGHGNMQV